MADTRVKVNTPIRAAGRFVWRHPRSVAASLAVGAATCYVGYVAMLIGAGSVVVAGGSWRLLDAPTFDRFAGRLLRAWWRRWAVYRRRWFALAYRVGLVVTDHRGRERLPVVERVSSSWSWDHVRVRMVDTQAPEDYEAVVGRIANAYGALRGSVRVLGPSTLSLDLQRREPFHDMHVPVPTLSDHAAGVDLAQLVLGRDEYGRDFALNLASTHVLVGGATGAGKGSVLWGLLRSLAAMIRAGWARVWVIDPKGGMEFSAGAGMFHRFATSDEEGVELLAEYTDVLDDRKAELGAAGLRSFTPSVETPLELLVVDELAAMTEYADRSIQKEFEPMLGKALTQYRAPGGRVVAAVQEPTKDTVPMRGLFPTKLAMRLDSESYVDMCLGEGMRDRGALADQIPEFLPGVGYCKVDGRREPLRFRAGYSTDHDIADLVAFCTAGPGAEVVNLRATGAA
ncbi:FtsK/SpoIIIE domain-containing protein [Saccharopolyspora sp. NFXS83]|uniref:FtsK/SpoIIIE domain-containing protein n=1 Tax=Saccharopolyspora sp. NFXS83 TaxID=2993560 RepID=UPI00224AC5B1|nr:FtsK/SpoIIIE domain-containing protein [Saccharopolyspora sp. NFXS83]MCX2734450.1 FtsK/SpoIIIE domain-containing protein [Saccharopolyspora sp. NFXS83]